MKFIIDFNLIEAYYVGTEVIKMKRIPIQEAISEAGLKKKYVAECLGISETYLNTYLSSPQNISVKNASIICKLTNKNIDEIDFGTEDNIFFSR